MGWLHRGQVRGGDMGKYGAGKYGARRREAGPSFASADASTARLPHPSFFSMGGKHGPQLNPFRRPPLPPMLCTGKPTPCKFRRSCHPPFEPCKGLGSLFCGDAREKQSQAIPQMKQPSVDPNFFTKSNGPVIHVRDMPRRAVGEIVVIGTTPTTSTGMIVFSMEDVHAGDGIELDEQSAQ